MDNTKLFLALKRCETDVEGSLSRFYGDEELYVSFLSAFLFDKTMETLRDSIKEKKWEQAFMASHALKGVAGNLGFVPLYHAVAELVLILRSSKISEIDNAYKEIEDCYKNIVNAIEISKEDK